MSEWCKEHHGKVSCHFIHSHLESGVHFQSFVYTKISHDIIDCFLNSVFTWLWVKKISVIGIWTIWCMRPCQSKEFNVIPSVMCLSQDWPRLYDTVKSPWNKPSTSSCPLSGSTPPQDSVPLLVSSSRSEMIMLLGWFVSCLPHVPLPPGNSVHADKRFLEKYMPQFMYHLHYRIVDVSTIKELCRPVLCHCCAGYLKGFTSKLNPFTLVSHSNPSFVLT